MAAYTAISSYGFDETEEESMRHLFGGEGDAPPPFSSETLTPSQFRWRMLGRGALNSLVVTGIPILMGLYAVGYVAYHAPSAEAFLAELDKQHAFGIFAGLLGLQALCTGIGFLVYNGHRASELSQAQERMRILATEDGMSINHGETILNAPWAHWKIARLDRTSIPEGPPDFVINAFWLTAPGGSIRIDPDHFLNGRAIWSRAIHAMLRAQS